jgi:hypothetical protein
MRNARSTGEQLEVIRKNLLWIQFKKFWEKNRMKWAVIRRNENAEALRRLK